LTFADVLTGTRNRWNCSISWILRGDTSEGGQFSEGAATLRYWTTIAGLHGHVLDDTRVRVFQQLSQDIVRYSQVEACAKYHTRTQREAIANVIVSCSRDTAPMNQIRLGRTHHSLPNFSPALDDPCNIPSYTLITARAIS
jgi:hypothetical protein